MTEEVRFNFDDQPPSLLVSEYALASKWFTEATYAENFFLTNTFSQDDCTPQASIPKTFTNLVKNCAATKATVTATGTWSPLCSTRDGPSHTRPVLTHSSPTDFVSHLLPLPQ